MYDVEHPHWKPGHTSFRMVITYAVIDFVGAMSTTTSCLHINAKHELSYRPHVPIFHLVQSFTPVTCTWSCGPLSFPPSAGVVHATMHIEWYPLSSTILAYHGALANHWISYCGTTGGVEVSNNESRSMQYWSPWCSNWEANLMFLPSLHLRLIHNDGILL